MQHHILCYPDPLTMLVPPSYRAEDAGTRQLPPLPCHLVPPKPKYSPQHPILQHPQPTFLPQCQRPSFTPIQNNRQYYSSMQLVILNEIYLRIGLHRCASSRTVPGSISGGVTGFFSDIFPSDRTVALESTQPLMKMSTRNISWG